jgi:hypothetical protein
MDEVGIERSRERDVSLSIAAKTVLPAWLWVEEKEMEALKSSMKNMEESEREQVWQVMQFIDTQYWLINTESKLNDAMVWLNPVVHDNTEMKGAANIHKRLMVKDTAWVTWRKRLNDILKSMVIVDVHTPEVYENLQQEYLKTLQILYGWDIVEDKVGWVTVMTSEWNEFVSKVFFPQNQSSSQTFGTRYESWPVSAKYGQIDWDDIDTATSVDELDDDTYIMEPGVDTIDTQRKDI